MEIFRKLDPELEKDFRSWVDKDKSVVAFIERARLWHPVIRDEICKRLQ